MAASQQARNAPALSIRQPWGELILSGRKDVEVRTWSHDYRGLLWLHAGKRVDEAAVERYQLEGCFTGGLVGIAQLAAIERLTADTYEAWRSRHLDWSPFPAQHELYGWILKGATRLAPPRPYGGALGLFPVRTEAFSDDELEGLVSSVRSGID